MNMKQQLDQVAQEISVTFQISPYQIFAPGQDRTVRNVLFYTIRKKHQHVPASFIAEHFGVPVHFIYGGARTITNQLLEDKRRMMENGVQIIEI